MGSSKRLNTIKMKIILLYLYICSIFTLAVFLKRLLSQVASKVVKSDSDLLSITTSKKSALSEGPQRITSNEKVVVPFLSGQGLNNQLWEYQSYAIIARALGRTLCLEPFHRFYLITEGRKFIPFHELFNSEALRKYVNVAQPEVCSTFCNRTVQKSFLLVHKAGVKINKKSPYPIPDWRPGSLKKFLISTGFEEIPTPQVININEQRGGIKYHTLTDIKNAFKDTNDARCVSVSGHTLSGPEDEMKNWKKALRVSNDIEQTVQRVRREIFGEEPYLAIHWRFEESKCSGIGRSIGYGRDRKSSSLLDSNKANFVIKRSDTEAEFCFFAGPIMGTPKVLLRLVSKKAIVRWMLNIKKRSGASFIYLSTDCADTNLIRWIKKNTGAITRSDILPILHNKIDNDVVSRIEQQICVGAFIFAGTQTSSWTAQVIDERFLHNDKFFIQNSSNLHGNLDKFSNQTLYFDVEVCDCDSQG